MSYYIIKYEFMGQDSAGLRGGEVQFQVSKFFEVGKTGDLHGCNILMISGDFSDSDHPSTGIESNH